MRKVIASVALAALFTSISTNAFAGFNEWTSETESDPFSKSSSVVVSNITTGRSGALILCDGAKKTIRIRSIPGFVYTSDLELITPELKIAIDGDVILTDLEGSTGCVGDNLAASETELADDDAKKFIEHFKIAKKQIAISNGISDRPMLLNARGSTKTGAELEKCFNGK